MIRTLSNTSMVSLGASSGIARGIARGLARGLACALLLSACGYAKEETVKAMQEDIAKLQQQLEMQEKKGAELRHATQEADAQLARLKQQGEEAQRAIKSVANMAGDLDRLKADMAQAQGKLDENNTTLANLTKNFGESRAKFDTQLEQLTNATTTAKSPPVPETPDAVFADAEKRVDAKQYADARRLLDAFGSRYAQDPRAAKAQLLIGDTYLDEKKFANAINAYTKVIDNFSKSDAVEPAMYKNGLAFYQLKYCSDARVYFQELMRRYPKSEFKNDVKTQLDKLTKDLKNKAVCAS